jgi:hypothetical protein
MKPEGIVWLALASWPVPVVWLALVTCIAPVELHITSHLILSSAFQLCAKSAHDDTTIQGLKDDIKIALEEVGAEAACTPACTSNPLTFLPLFTKASKVSELRHQLGQAHVTLRECQVSSQQRDAHTRHAENIRKEVRA